MSEVELSPEELAAIEAIRAKGRQAPPTEETPAQTEDTKETENPTAIKIDGNDSVAMAQAVAAANAAALAALHDKAKELVVPESTEPEVLPPETSDALTLNKKRPYGVCSPIDGRKRYFQDGKYFDYAGTLVDEE